MTEQQARKYRAIIEAGAQGLTDAEAVIVKTLYPVWAAGQSYKVGDKIAYNGGLYKILQAHTSQEAWKPGAGTESLYARIDEQHGGTQNDPIPYNGNMALVSGTYYSQGGMIYRCTRDTDNPVYNALSELVGLYVTVVETI